MGKNLKVEITPETIYGPSWRSVIPIGYSIKRLGMPAPGEEYVDELGKLTVNSDRATMMLHRLIVTQNIPTKVTLTLAGKRIPRPGDWVRDRSGDAFYLVRNKAYVATDVYTMTSEPKPDASFAAKTETNKKPKKIALTLRGKGRPKAGE